MHDWKFLYSQLIRSLDNALLNDSCAILNLSISWINRLVSKNIKLCLDEWNYFNNLAENSVKFFQSHISEDLDPTVSTRDGFGGERVSYGLKCIAHTSNGDKNMTEIMIRVGHKRGIL